MDSEEKRLLEEIRNGLQAKELPYEPGRWEEFCEQYAPKLTEIRVPVRRPRGVVRRWKPMAAAAVLIGALLAFWLQRDEPSPWPVGTGARSSHGLPAATGHAGVFPPVAERADEVPATSGRVGAMPGSLASAAPVMDTIRLVSVVPPSTRQWATLPMAGPAEGSRKWPSVRSQSLQTSVIRVADAPSRAETVPDRHQPTIPVPGPADAVMDRWRFGFEVAPALAAEHVHVGAGLVMQYTVTPTLSIQAGVSYSQLTGRGDLPDIQLSYDTRIVGAEATLKTIDVPVSLAYEPKKGWYASVGVSALAVVDERQYQRLERAVLQESVAIDPESGAELTVFDVVRHAYREEQPGRDFKGKGMLGFVNLSAGRKQRIGGRTELMVEPFVRIPAGGLSNRNLDWVNSGVKLKVMF